MRLIDIINGLIERERYLEAEYYRIVIPTQVLLKHGLSEKTVLQMDIDDIERLYKMPAKPAKYDGWNFWWGECAVADLY